MVTDKGGIVVKHIAVTVLIWAILAAGVLASDLYFVTPQTEADIELLHRLSVAPVARTSSGYLVLVDSDPAASSGFSSLQPRLIAEGVSATDLALDRRMDSANVDNYELLYSEGGFRLFRVPPGTTTSKSGRAGLLAVGDREPTLEPIGIKSLAQPSFNFEDITWLVDQVSQDTVTDYLFRMEAFNGRVAGEDSTYAAAVWIRDRYLSYGLDSAYLDFFQGMHPDNYASVDCQNVIGVKIGSIYPDRRIVICGHYDAVPRSPGADDNGTGTVSVIESARILSQVDNEMTLVFIAFDSEESGLVGSYEYAWRAKQNNNDIVLVLNADMIGELQNSNYALSMFRGNENYPRLWNELADEYAGIYGFSFEAGSNSDHWPFFQYGYDVMFVHEEIFSTKYHTPRDSTTYVNFDYFTRMVKANVAMAYTVSQAPPPTETALLEEPGDGYSKRITWRPLNNPDVVGYQVCRYYHSQPWNVVSFDVGLEDTVAIVTGLTPGNKYRFFVRAIDVDGNPSVSWNELEGTPYVEPRPPEDFLALPLLEGVHLEWQRNNVELDFDHYEIWRDGAVVGATTDTTFDDYDPTLDTLYHNYWVRAADTDHNLSPTLGVDPAVMRAATLTPGKILAVNRSLLQSMALVDEVETGVFMREALEGYDYVYRSDTAATVTPQDTAKLHLVNMIDYEVVVVADEGRGDQIGASPEVYGILDTLAYFMSIGGKVILFGRWGDFDTNDTIDFLDNSPIADDSYANYFHIESLVRTLTEITSPSAPIYSDLIGAHSVVDGYGYLPWDSLRTVGHSAPFPAAEGVPLASFVSLNSAEAEIIYTYDTRHDHPLGEGKPVAWRYLGDDYKYVFFDLPLSFMDRTAAKLAFRTALGDLMGVSPDCCELRGDVNNDGEGPDISDLVYLADFMFLSGPAPVCAEVANTNGDDVNGDISDLVWIVDFMFRGGPPPVACP